MEYYKLRVDLVQCKVSEVLTWVSNYCSEVYCYACEKMDENPHIQLYLESDVPSRTLRSALRKLAGSGNGRYSLKEVERYPIEYLAYLMKEDDWFIYGQYSDIPDEICIEVLEYDAVVKSSIREKKESRKTQIQKLEEYMFSVPELKGKLGKLSQQTFVKIVVDWFKLTGTLFREFQVISLSQTLYLKYSEDGSRDLTDRILQKMGYVK